MEGASLWFVVAAVLRMGSRTTGLTCLEHPQNVAISVINSNITLKWDWDNPCGLNVTFSVQYHRQQQYLSDLEAKQYRTSLVVGEEASKKIDFIVGKFKEFWKTPSVLFCNVPDKRVF